MASLIFYIAFLILGCSTKYYSIGPEYSKILQFKRTKYKVRFCVISYPVKNWIWDELDGNKSMDNFAVAYFSRVFKSVSFYTFNNLSQFSVQDCDYTLVIRLTNFDCLNEIGGGRFYVTVQYSIYETGIPESFSDIMRKKPLKIGILNGKGEVGWHGFRKDCSGDYSKGAREALHSIFFQLVSVVLEEISKREIEY